MAKYSFDTSLHLACIDYQNKTETWKILLKMVKKITPKSRHSCKMTKNVKFEFWHFSAAFGHIKVTPLVKLFDSTFQVIKILQIAQFLAFLSIICPFKMRT